MTMCIFPLFFIIILIIPNDCVDMSLFFFSLPFLIHFATKVSLPELCNAMLCYVLRDLLVCLKVIPTLSVY